MFEKGHKKIGGRGKGDRVQMAEDVRNALAKLQTKYITGDQIKELEADLDAMRPVDRAATHRALLSYWLPTMGTMAVKGQADGEVNIVVTYNSPDPAALSDEDERANGGDYSESID